MQHQHKYIRPSEKQQEQQRLFVVNLGRMQRVELQTIIREQLNTEVPLLEKIPQLEPKITREYKGVLMQVHVTLAETHPHHTKEPVSRKTPKMNLSEKTPVISTTVAKTKI